MTPVMTPRLLVGALVAAFAVSAAPAAHARCAEPGSLECTVATTFCQVRIPRCYV